MKRSEMVEKLSIMLHCYGEFGEIMDGDLSEYLAEFTLKTMEEAGMLPPHTQVDRGLNGSCKLVILHEWEKEE